jgi:hypothetical protein
VVSLRWVRIGMDTEDREYDSIQDLWDFELGATSSSASEAVKVPSAASASLRQKWYASAYIYWENEANCPLSGILCWLLWISLVSSGCI